LPATGAASSHVVAYTRGDTIAVVTTRLPVGLARAGGWRETTVALPGGEWRDALTDRTATPLLADLLSQLPVALLVRTDG